MQINTSESWTSTNVFKLSIYLPIIKIFVHKIVKNAHHNSPEPKVDYHFSWSANQLTISIN